jgi:hypothetical protein
MKNNKPTLPHPTLGNSRKIAETAGSVTVRAGLSRRERFYF